MSMQQKSIFRKATRIIGISLFVIMIFFNFQISTNVEKNDGLDLFGLNFTVFVPDMFATEPCGGNPCTQFGRHYWWDPISIACDCPVPIYDSECYCAYRW